MAVTPGTDRARSLLIVPMLAGERLLGSVHLEDHERDHAFGADPVSLVQTIASGMAVALLNVRSFEAERPRSAELSVINSIQQAVGAELNFQAIGETVGRKPGEVFGSEDLSILWWDEATGLISRRWPAVTCRR